MFWSRFYIPTLKEAPADADVISNKLMIRAGMIRKLAGGLYVYMPYGHLALARVTEIVRREMNRAGAIELAMPMVQPADLWRESGRWEKYGKELLRFKDRHERDFCLGPTHEEVITEIVRGEVRSYRQLPLNLYQIQTKFRDEIRPRFGLMRGREFVMKDAYSFDRDDEGADRSYKAMYEAYMRIFRRLGLRFRAVEADSGAIGGSFSHEFMVLADTGEDAIAACGSCAYAANLERVEVRDSGRRPASVPPPLEEISTPGLKSIEAVSGFLRVEPRALVKTLLLRVDGRKVGALVRGDRTLNEVKVKNYFQAGLVELLEPEEARDLMGVPVGFAGPVDLKADCMLADYELREATGWIAGGNRPDTHLRNLDLGRDAKVTDYADLRDITGQDPCPRCGGPLSLPRGIEVGHVFKLGTKYSSAMRAVYLDESGEEKTMIMGCYGIGVSRVLAACIEQNHDGNGIIFPPAIAPFTVEVLPLDLKAEAVRDKALEIHDFLTAEGLDALLDDRDERPGVKFKDADLLGAPMQIIVGAKGLEKGVLEVKDRRSGEKSVLPAEDFAAALRAWKDGVLSGWSVPGT